MTQRIRDGLSEQICNEITSDVDRWTLDAGLSRRDAAQIYREIASECRDRANGLDEEAEADGE